MLDGFMDRYVRISVADPAEVEQALWSAGPPEWEALPPGYSAALLEQYKLCVEMADRVSARRTAANSFFLTLNTTVLTLFGVFWQERSAFGAGWLTFPALALVVQCIGWYWMLRSYRQLNTAKYVVIGLLEKRLPASAYWSAEWTALGRGQVPARYLPLTQLEQWVPALFAAGYLSALALALVVSPR
ncbi:MAG TPA: hypothetical protein VI248_08350 [Kineosporiaceae bacterium]